MYTIILAASFLWFLWAERIFHTAPDSAKNIVIFLLLLFASLVLTVSIPIYFYFYKKAAQFSDLRRIYRRALSLSSLISFIVTGFAALRAFSLLNPINAGLFAVLCVAIAIQGSKSN